MGLLTTTELIQEVRGNLLNRTDVTDGEIINALNFAQEEISRVHDFRELQAFFTVNTQFTSSAFNDKFVPLNNLVKHIHTAVLLTGDTASRKLAEKPWRMFDRLFPAPEVIARSRPVIYSRWNQNLILYPVPDAVYAIFMRTTNWPSTLSVVSGTQVSDYDHKDEVIIGMASGHLWGKRGRYDKRKFFLDEANFLLDTSIKQDNDRPDMDVDIDLAGIGQVGNYWVDPFVKGMPM